MSCKRKETLSKKLAVLEVIRNEKKLLFGAFSAHVSHKMKEDGWQKVLEVAKANGLVSDNRDWTFVRDKLFSVWKSRTLAKKDNARTTGSGGGKDKILDEVDNIILDIIEPDSPAVQGIGGPESQFDRQDDANVSSEDEEFTFANVLRTSTPKEELRLRNEMPSCSNEVPAAKRRKSNTSASINRPTSAANLKEEKDSLKVQLLKSQMYLNKLNALKLERVLGLKPSEYTAELPQQGAAQGILQFQLSDSTDEVQIVGECGILNDQDCVVMLKD